LKTKKVLALVVLAAMLVSIMPMMAFGDISIYSSTVVPPEGSESATAAIYVSDGTKDGTVFEVVLVKGAEATLNSANLYMASSRGSVDKFFWSNDDDGPWYLITGITTGTSFANTGDGSSTATGSVTLGMSTIAATGLTSKTVYIKVQSATAGRPDIVFGTDYGSIGSDSVVGYARGLSFDGTIRAQDAIIGRQRYPIEFTAAEPDAITLEASGGGVGKPANGVDTYTLTAFVTVGGVPASGKDVTFSIKSGVGATLTATKATTNAAGKAEVKIYGTRAAAIVVNAKVKTNVEADTTVNFGTTGVVNLRSESSSGSKVARTGSGTKRFTFSAYDASGSRMDYLSILSAAVRGNNGYMDRYFKDTLTAGDLTAIGVTSLSGPGLKAVVVTKPSGANLKDADLTFSINSAGNPRLDVPVDKLSKDGDYEVKAYLPNGVTVSWTFSAKEQGDVTSIGLSYGSKSYSAGTVLPQPEVEWSDAEGYETSEDLDMTTNSNLKLSISDASFMDGKMNATTGAFKLKDDKSGVITMTVVDTNKNLVGTQVLNIEKAASYLKLTPQSVGAVGGEVTVDIELVDVDGKLAATGIEANTHSANVIAKPEGAIASASTVDVSDFKQGEANVKVSSNVAGDVTLQVIIVEKVMDNGTATDASDDYGGRTYTGAATISFGATSGGGGQIIFIIGSPTFVTGNTPHLSESPAFVDNGRTFLGVRDIGTAIGAVIEWDQDSQTATLSKDLSVVKVTVGASAITLTKSGVTSEVPIDAPAQNKDGRVYLPFRAVLEAFGYEVSWDQATQSIVCK
jgi:hypothetical protein